MASAAGWKPHFILWGVPYALLMTMTADAPRFVSEEESAKIEKPNNKSTVGIFQTMLKNYETR